MIRYLNLSLLLFLSLFSQAIQAQENTPRFSGLLNNVAFLENGDKICLTSKAVYLIHKDRGRWTVLSKLSPQRIDRIIGGSKDKLYFVEAAEGVAHLFLKSYSTDGTIETVLRLRGAPYSFFSNTIGCSAEGSRLLVTVNKGAKWTESQPIFVDKEAILQLLWLSPYQLAVGGSKGTLALVSVDETGIVKPGWQRKQPAPVQSLAGGPGNTVWSLGRRLTAYDTTTGEIKREIVPDLPVEDFLASGEYLYLWGFEGVSVWHLKGAKTVHVKRIRNRPVAYVLPIEGHTAQVFTMAGEIFKWDIRNKELQPNQVVVETKKVQAVKKDEVSTEHASSDELRKMVQTSLELAFELRQKVFAAANEKKELTPKQRVQWTIQEFERLRKEEGKK